MASADLRKELECSICLNIYTDPVILKCGHNFCRVCMDQFLDTQQRSGSYSCPECRQKFKKRPDIQRNMKLRSIVENLFSRHSEEIGIFCTYCIHTGVPAVKSCLHCEAFLCDSHLSVHNKSSEHVLCDPTSSPMNIKCSVHKKIHKNDSTCIWSCKLHGEQREHQVKTLDETTEVKKRLKKVLSTLKAKRDETEKRVQSLQERRRKLQGKAACETERFVVLFRDLRVRLEDLEKKVLSEISRQAKQVSLSLSDLIQRLEIKKDGLSRKLGYIEEQLKDPLTALQESDISDLCVTEDGDDHDREKHEELLHGGADVDMAGILHTLDTGLSDIMSRVNAQIWTGTHVSPSSSTRDKVHLPSPYLQPAPTRQHSNHQVGGSNIGHLQQPFEIPDLLLDVCTAAYNLHISDDRKTASFTYETQNRLETQVRFQDYPQVLSSKSFSSGRHCWEVEVGGSGHWTAGMCYPSIDRRRRQSAIGYNKSSWCLERWNNQYSVIHDKKEIPLLRNVSSNRIKIDLDYEAGRISFYELCDPIQHLYTFTSTFTEPLHPVLGIWGGSITIFGGNCEKSAL